MFEWITQAVERGSYAGVFLLMLVENVFPPIPSEVIMPLAGYIASRGQLTFWGVLLAGTFGSLAGTSFWYALGRWLGRDRLKRFAARHGRWLTLSPADIDRASGWFAQRGHAAVLLGRLVPGIRTLISVPAGVAGMPLLPFLATSAVGTFFWTGLLAAAGYQLGESYGAVGRWIEPVGNGVLVLVLALYLYRVVTFDRPARELP
ncbi:MAG: DedA family protein [Pseudomonadota bacterium]